MMSLACRERLGFYTSSTLFGVTGWYGAVRPGSAPARNPSSEVPHGTPWYELAGPSVAHTRRSQVQVLPPPPSQARRPRSATWAFVVLRAFYRVPGSFYRVFNRLGRSGYARSRGTASSAPAFVVTTWLRHAISPTCMVETLHHLGVEAFEQRQLVGHRVAHLAQQSLDLGNGPRPRRDPVRHLEEPV